MAGIDKIVIKNFKAFAEEEILNLNGKHLLLYGENGSGKSSIYWALYTLFQGKDRGDESHKYFTKDHDENLLNIHVAEAETSYIEISLNDEPNVKFRIDISGVNQFGASLKTEDVMDSLNRNSDFITHRLLINFYNFRNSKDIDLWPVFERDIIPFLKNKKGDGDRTLSQVYKDIIRNKPYKIVKGNKIHYDKASQPYLDKLIEFNNDLKYWINEINTDVNTFFQTHFAQDDSDKINIQLHFEEPNYLAFRNLIQTRELDGISYSFTSNIKDLNTPVIRLSLQAEKKDGTSVTITRPQSYLNEAKLTAIALSIRFTLLADHIRVNYSGRILALDDLLVSLDMSNRDKVLDLLLNEYAADFKYHVYLLTHDRSFFNMARKRLESKNLLSEWEVKEIIMDEKDGLPCPVFPENGDNLSLTQKYISAHDYPAALNCLRRETERILKDFLPPNYSQTSAPSGETDYLNLEGLIIKFHKFHVDYSQDFSKYEKLKEYKDILLNPFSHDNIDSPLFKEEVKTVFEFVKELAKIRSKIICKIEARTTLILTENDASGSIYKYTLRPLENTRAFNLNSELWYVILPKCDFIQKENPDGTIELFGEKYKSLTINDGHDKIRHFLRIKEIEEPKSLLKIVSFNGTKLKDLI